MTSLRPRLHLGPIPAGELRHHDDPLAHAARQRYGRDRDPLLEAFWHWGVPQP